jgi:hypothetical protein
MELKIATETVSPDEPCMGLQECNRLMPGAGGATEWHRVQCVYVVRGDAIAEHVRDLGPAVNFEGIPETKMLGFGEESVALFQEQADRDRADDYYRKLQRELHEGSSLIKDFIDQKERNWKLIRNQSVFGPSVTRQRNGFPYQDVHKQALAQGSDN